MRLYYATGTCSLFPHIVANEAGVPLDLERVDIARTPHVTEDGSDYGTVNPKGYVPALKLDDGAILTEGVAIAQYLAELKPERGLAPAPGTRERAELQSWLTFIATELHKLYSPWLFHSDYGSQAQDVARRKIGERLAFVERHLTAGGPFLLGESFSTADAYLFTIVGWSAYTGIALSDLPHLRAFLDRVSTRPAVRTAQLAQGLEAKA